MQLLLFTITMKESIHELKVCNNIRMVVIVCTHRDSNTELVGTYIQIWERYMIITKMK